MTYANCLKCHRPLSNPKSMEVGYGPVCAGKSGASQTHDGDHDLLLDEITEPFDGDVILRRIGDDTTGEAIANIPHSVIWHSPTGFNWGYGGSGPADLALNILNAFVPPGSDGEEQVKCFRGKCSATAQRLHQDFKREFLAGMDIAGGVIKAEEIKQWIKSHGN